MKPADEARWQTALERRPALRRLAETPRTTRAEVEEQARELGISASTIYRLLRRFRKAGTVDSIVAQPRGWRPQVSRLPNAVEEILSSAIESFYLAQPACSLSDLHREIIIRCSKAEEPAPARSTIARRVARLSRRRTARRRLGAGAAEAVTVRPGHYTIDQSNAVWQIDHSPMDVIVVDSKNRQPIGRPWLTLVIDVASRLIPGLHVSLEAPSVVSVGLALRHAILPKSEALNERGIAGDWPAGGLPDALHSDNGSDFRSEAFARACANLGIETIRRPVRRPRYGGHIERLIGTAQTALHLLPGTTFSNPKRRGEYDSDKTAALTLDELETWIWRYVACDYNRRIHSTTGRPPLLAWLEGQDSKAWTPRKPANPEQVATEFLPAVPRLIARQGITLHGISYYEPFLATLFDGAERRVLVHYDPRDMSRVFLRGEDGFQAVRYRNLANPPLALWEIRAARRALVAEGRANIDEAALIAARQANAELVAQGQRMTRRERLNAERRVRGHGLATDPGQTAVPRALGAVDEPINISVEVGAIEQW